MREIGRRVREYLGTGFDGDRLMLELGQAILKDDNGQNLLHTLRTVFDEWTLCAGHPARNQLLGGGYAPAHRCAVSRADGTALRAGRDGGGALRAGGGLTFSDLGARPWVPDFAGRRAVGYGGRCGRRGRLMAGVDRKLNTSGSGAGRSGWR